ncbi:unnamed protein product [Enterobius vermicularis]|uniref:Ras-associating domain-containing protein n=1 Tax=Enterobius vermicularis TaxID=51028 RepID=A0A0N4V1H6_ENTVE|nr:unnamed protein product [Enterobius vermicularis]
MALYSFVYVYRKNFVRSDHIMKLRGLNSHDTTKNQTFIFQLITDDAWSNQQNAMVTVQSLLERSLHSSNVQFDEAPRILILQLPRYGKEKLFCIVAPEQELDVTHLIYNSRVTFCAECFKLFHERRNFDHSSSEIKYTKGLAYSSQKSLRKHTLQLSAVLSIETSHYVTFARIPHADKWLLQSCVKACRSG